MCAVVTIAELIKKKFPHFDTDEKVIRTVNFKFAAGVWNAVTFQDATIAMDLSSAGERIPSKTTINELRAKGYMMNGPFYEGTELTTCFKERKMHIIKRLDFNENTRAQEFSTAFSDSYSPLVITFELFTSSKGKAFMIMPVMRYSIDKVPSPFLGPGDVNLLWSHMESALSGIHSEGFAFMDVKPANICSDDDGYHLIDLGSIVPIGQTTSYTEAYIPSDLNKSPSSAEIDYWMLGVALAECGCGSKGLPVSTSDRRFSRKAILIQLEQYLPKANYLEFLSRVGYQ